MGDFSPHSSQMTGMPSPSPPAREWQSRTVNSPGVAENLLDWAKSQGFLERKLMILGMSEFVVLWR
jgi:hypothetical protein